MTAETTRIALTRLTLPKNAQMQGRRGREPSCYDDNNNDDDMVVNEYGDNALIRLLGTHTGIAQVDGLLRNCKNAAEISMHTNKDGVNALHMAVFRNGYQVKEIVSRLLEVTNHAVAKVPIFGSNMYALHISLAYSLTIETPLIDMLLQSNKFAATIRTSEGHSALDLLTANVQRFRWAHSKTLSCSLMQQQDYSYMTIISPYQYKAIGIKLLGAMEERELSWHLIAREAPVLLLRILLQEELNVGLWEADETGQYALHCARCPQTAELLLETTGSACNRPDHSGRWPLHQNPDSLVLAMDAPEALAHVDPISGLFPYQLAATGTADIETIYKMLRMNPSVVQSSMQ